MKKSALIVCVLMLAGGLFQHLHAQYLIPFRKGDKWGFCDVNKTIIIPIQYEWAEPFSEGLAAVKKNGRFGFINKQGKVIIDFKYDYAKKFEGGLAQVRNNKGVLIWINRKGVEYYED